MVSSVYVGTPFSPIWTYYACLLNTLLTSCQLQIVILCALKVEKVWISFVGVLSRYFSCNVLNYQSYQ